LLGVKRAVVERVEFDQGEDVLVVGVRPGAPAAGPVWGLPAPLPRV